MSTRPPSDQDFDHHQAVGVIAAFWAELERNIEEAVWRLADIQPAAGLCLTGPMLSAHVKLTSLTALFQLHELPDKHIKALKEFKNKLSGTSDKRNRAVHDPWHYSIYTSGNAKSPASLSDIEIAVHQKTMTVTRDGTLQVYDTAATEDEYDSIRGEIRDQIERFKGLIEAAYTELSSRKKLPPRRGSLPPDSFPRKSKKKEPQPPPRSSPP